MPNMAPPEGGSENAITDKVANSEVIWGVKRGIGTGPRGKDVQFYDSFTFDGEEYFRYDCVYLHAEGEPEPYIGKIMKIWQDRKEKKNKMKVMWFFRPIEIPKFLQDEIGTSNKEIFLAAGEGKGVDNINLLEVIVGKCKVLCTSSDQRNPQPSEEDLNNADYFFNRTFDVGKYTVSDNLTRIEDAIFNKKAWVSKSVASPDRQANSAKANKTMENGSFLLDKDMSEPGITKEGLMKKKGEKEVSFRKQTVKEEHDVREIPKDKAKEDEIARDGLNKNEVLTEEVNNQIPKEEQQNAQNVEEKLEGNENKEGLNTADNSKEKNKRNQSPNEEQEKNEIAMDELKNSESLKEQEKEINIAKEKLSKAEPEILSKIAYKESVPKKSLQLEVRSTEKKDNKYESSKEEKKSLKRMRVMVDSEDEDEINGIQMEGSKIDSRKTLDSKKESSGPEIKVVKKAKLIDTSVKSEAIPKSTMQLMELNMEKKLGREIITITKRPEVESNKWFKGLAWDERLQKGYEQKAVIRIQNFDPSYTSSEIEDVMWHMFGERCAAKALPRTLYSNPSSGDALVVFKTKEGADTALKKLNQECLMFSDGRPLVASKAGPVTSGKQKYAGHISVEKHKLLMHRSHRSEDMRKAVSTSHCSQPNTIEFEMAMDWRLLQEKSKRWWNELYKQEESEVKNIKQKNQISMKKN